MNESADAYARVVCQLNPHWRIIECQHGAQWILQRRGSPKTSRTDDWRGRSYFRTSDALRRCVREHAGIISPDAAVVLASLPDRFENSSTVVTTHEPAAPGAA